MTRKKAKAEPTTLASIHKMTTITSLRQERNEWKRRAFDAEVALREAQARNTNLLAFFDGLVQQMARLLNLARDVK